MPDRISRAAEADRFGPTIGDKVRLADTDLIIEVEKDFTTGGADAKLAGSAAIRDGTGERQITRARGAVDTVVTGALIVDHWGIVKADVGIRDGKIAGIGKAGDPDVEPGVDIIVGPGTEAICGKGKLLTAGALDMHIHFIAPRPIEEALAAGVTTMLGGRTGPARGTTPDARHIGRMIRAAQGCPMNLAFAGKGDAALEEQVTAGAAALQLDQDWGTTPAAIDACLTVADALDVQVLIDTDTLNEAAFVDNTIAAFKDRAIHATHTEGAPDIIKLCGLSNVLPSSTNATRPFTVNTVAERLDRLMVRHRLDPSIAQDVAFAESRTRRQTIAADDILHDIGALSMIASDSQAVGRVGEVIIRTFQAAHQMKVQRGRLAEESGDNDNFRVKRYIAKVTINPAITHGIDEWVGSIEIGKLADLVMWSPAFFGVRPDLILKLGAIAAAPMGDANASNPTAPPDRPIIGALGKAVTFVSRAALDDGLADKLGLDRPLYPVHNTRAGVSKEAMIHNAARPKIEIDPRTYEVRADGERLTCPPAEVLPMAQRYFLF